MELICLAGVVLSVQGDTGIAGGKTVYEFDGIDTGQ